MGFKTPKRWTFSRRLRAGRTLLLDWRLNRFSAGHMLYLTVVLSRDRLSSKSLVFNHIFWLLGFRKPALRPLKRVIILLNFLTDRIEGQIHQFFIEFFVEICMLVHQFVIWVWALIVGRFCLSASYTLNRLLLIHTQRKVVLPRSDMVVYKSFWKLVWIFWLS